MGGVGEGHEVAELLQGGHASSVPSIKNLFKIDWNDGPAFAT
jgi:hypothetical protein